MPQTLSSDYLGARTAATLRPGTLLPFVGVRLRLLEHSTSNLHHWGLTATEPEPGGLRLSALMTTAKDITLAELHRGALLVIEQRRDRARNGARRMDRAGA